jgi:hypothetical protein
MSCENQAGRFNQIDREYNYKRFRQELDRPVPLLEYLELVKHKDIYQRINELKGNGNRQGQERPEVKLTAGTILMLAFLGMLNFLSDAAGAGIQGQEK